MRWLLLLSIFTGPTSADRLETYGPFESKYACLQAAQERQEHQERSFGFVCLPLWEEKK